MSVYVSKRNESKVEFLETARKLSAHTLTYCLKAPKRLTFFLTKDICVLARRVYYEANTANGILPRNKIEAQNRRNHFQLALSACENMEIPLAELKARLLQIRKIWGVEIAVLNEELAGEYKLTC